MQNHSSTMACVSSFTEISSFKVMIIDDMCVWAESLEVEVTIRYQLVVQWLECSLTMTKDSGSIPRISDH
jgi:hypothetical protein